MNILKSLILKNKPIPWQKRGQVFQPPLDDFSHGSHPCIIHLEGDDFLIAFTRRDKLRKSHIFLVTATISGSSLRLNGTPQLALSPGAQGNFDCDGVISVCFVKHKENIYLYYVGWQNLPENLWICDTGRATLNLKEMNLSKDFAGPVLGRDKTNPLFAAATAFYVEGDFWQTWYNSGIRWEKTNGGWKHYYGIHYAHSTNGVDWVCHKNMCLPFKDEYEYAFGRPCVLYLSSTYFMWYAHRATKTTDTYRIGFAYSTDGLNWTRVDELSGIDISMSGWDSEMICYPSVFEHKSRLYMLYNGNGYGKTGFGLAVLEEGL